MFGSYVGDIGYHANCRVLTVLILKIILNNALVNIMSYLRRLRHRKMK